MVFSELYSVYYNTVAKLICTVLEKNATQKDFIEIINENAFSESVLSIMPAITEEKWQVITKELKTPIKHKPTMPLTTIQKQWLKAISSDPRIKLFNVDFSSLDGVEPLFTDEDYRIFDKYSNGDNFEDERYIANFRIILKAVKEGLLVRATVVNKNGNPFRAVFMPLKLEYSEKDDKFRVVTDGCKYVSTINLSKIADCGFYVGPWKLKHTASKPEIKELVLELKDYRNTLERCLLHFAHFEKQAEKLEGARYRLNIKYYADDIYEIVMRVLSFGPMVEVIEPCEVREQIKEKLKKQKNCGLL